MDPIVNDPRYEGFGLVDGALDDLPMAAEPETLSSQWVPLKVSGRVASYNDCPCIGLFLPAFSQRACDSLADLLQPNGELLPLETRNGASYYFYNCTAVRDVLDANNSKWRFFFYYTFHEELLEGLSVFRIPQQPTELLVTDKFVKRVQDAGLNGFDFTKVWPLPKGTNWRRQPRSETLKPNPLRELKCHSLIVVLPVKGKKPDAKERRAIKKFEDDLDAQLVIQSLDAPYFGSYEGSENPPGEFRMFLSCPDADRLEEKLRPWFTHRESSLAIQDA